MKLQLRKTKAFPCPAVVALNKRGSKLWEKLKGKTIEAVRCPSAAKLYGGKCQARVYRLTDPKVASLARKHGIKGDPGYYFCGHVVLREVKRG